MTMRKAWWAAALFLAGSFPAVAQEGAGKADEIVAKIEAFKLPQPDLSKREDAAYIQKFLADRQKAATEKAALIGQLYKADPKNEKLKALLPERWMALMGNPASQAEVDKEIAAILAAPGESPLKPEAAYVRMLGTLRASQPDGRKMLGAVDEFMKVAPKDERGPSILVQVAQFSQGLSDTEKKAIFERIRKDFPDSQAAAQVEAEMKKAEAVGKPFELAFNEAITGKSISMADLKGKVVVIDFWATWCGPCVAELPTMKKLYAEYQPKGVEFIGVSLDAPESEGGLEALKKFVAEKKIEWPQYYQGNGWESEFSMKWGINSIPALFVVDQQGNLHSMEARGKLETMIPELLKKGAAAGE